MPTDSPTHRRCPGADALQGLIRGRIPEGEQADLTGHLDACPGCQAQLETLAAGGDDHFSDVVRHIDRDAPPRDSAYWAALEAAEASVTQSLPVDGETTGELKLDFLQPADAPGRIGRLNRFEVIRVIGRGGMGVVLAAFDPSLQREVAVKILDPQLLNNELARQRFCREARAAASVTHDNIVAVHQVDIDEASGLPFIVMQMVNGETLEQRLKRVGKLSVTEAVRVGMQAAAGLASAHASGLIHRDVKPANILLEAGSDKVKLTDFGLARAAEDMKLTRSGFVAGTPLYMAPEQARGEEVDHRADLFSLGSVLYEALSGRPPFDGKTPLAVLRRIADEGHAPLGRLNPDVPDWLEDVIDRLLAKDPGDRFESAAEVAEILTARYACLQPPEAGPEPCPLAVSASKILGRRRRKRLALAVAVGGPFLAGALLGGLLVWGYGPRQTVEVPREVVRNGDAAVAAGGPAAPTGPAEAGILKGNNGAVLTLAVTADGKTAALGLENGEITIFDVPGQRRLATLARHAGPVWGLDFVAEGTRLVSASDDGSVRVWDLAGEGKVLHSLSHPSAVRSAAVSRAMNRVVTGARDGIVRVWDLADPNKPSREFAHGALVNAVAFAPDGLTVASAGSDQVVVLWDVPNDRKRVTLRGHQGPVYGVSFSPEGDWLASAGWDQSVILWDLKDGTPVRQIKQAHEEGVWGIDFACCGKVLATAGQDGVAKLWDAEKGAELARFTRHRGTVHAARFTADGTALLTGGRDGTARYWPIERPGKK